MRLNSPLLAVLGLLGVGAVALQLLSGSITLSTAGLRIAVAIGVLAVVDRVGVPLARALVGPGRTPEPEPDEGTS
ncbi:MAG: hypothetical protein JWN17_416 [Frankiales bacterium]|nr:hypothetical protein [Frankiales bacterium]